MADNATVSPEVGQEPAESQLPKVSGTSPGERGSADDVNTRILASLDALNDRMGNLEKSRAGMTPQEQEASLKKAAQQFSDRRFHKVEMLDPEDIKIVADAVRAAGDDPVKAAENLGLQAIIRSHREAAARQSEPVSERSPATSTAAPGKADEETRKARALKVLSKSGLSDEEKQRVYAEWGQKSYEAGSEAEAFDEALADLTAMAIATRTSAPVSVAGEVAVVESEESSVGAGAALPSGVGRTAATVVEKQDRVAGLYGQLDGLYKAPSKNAKEIHDLEAELRELGEDINSGPAF